MKKLLATTAMVILLSGPASAWYDGYGNWQNGYLDPLTSFLDGIFGPPVVQAQYPYPYYSYPVPKPRYYTYPVPVPRYYTYPVPVPAPTQNTYPGIVPPARQPCDTRTTQMFDPYGNRIYNETIDNCN
jgi:hypothetical protein